MKILLYTDVHFSKDSSIVRGRSEVFSLRLQNIINSLNWAEHLAEEKGCDEIVCLGDLFDTPNLTAEELTALTCIDWAPLHHTFLVGNHDADCSDLYFNAVNALSKPGFTVVTKATKIEANPGTMLYFLPYMTEDNRIDLNSFITELAPNKIVFSHNDIKGIRYGKFESKEGFDLQDIESHASMFINGHLHNGSYLNDKKTIINLGNLTGQNFSEDAFKYSHNVGILDTDTLKLELIENPYAFNFYKVEINVKKDLDFKLLKPNPVVSFKVNKTYLEELKEKIKDIPNIIYRFNVYSDVSTEVDKEQVVKLNNVDHLKQFYEFCINNIENSDVLEQELMTIVGGNAE